MKWFLDTRREWLLVFLVVPAWSPALLANPETTPPERPHNIHVTRGRMAVEGSVAVTRIRFFRHDLEAALATFRSQETFSLTAGPSSDSFFLAYFNDRFTLTANGDTLRPSIVSSGEEGDMWWYELQFSQRDTITSLTVRNETLFEMFIDQKHFLKVTLFPSGKSHALYFVDGSSAHKITVD